MTLEEFFRNINQQNANAASFAASAATNASLDNLNATLTRVENVLGNIRIPEIVQHKVGGDVNIVFSNGDAMTEKIAQGIASRVNQVIAGSINNMVHPVNGELVG